MWRVGGRPNVRSSGGPNVESGGESRTPECEGEVFNNSQG